MGRRAQAGQTCYRRPNKMRQGWKMKFRVSVAFATGVVVAASGLAVTEAEAQSKNTVTILRGTAAETVSVSQQRQGLPEIVRGRSAEAEPEEVERSSSQTGEWSFTSGRRLWLINRADGQVISCSVQSAGIVGRDKFRCVEGALAR